MLDHPANEQILALQLPANLHRFNRSILQFCKPRLASSHLETTKQELQPSNPEATGRTNLRMSFPAQGPGACDTNISDPKPTLRAALSPTTSNVDQSFTMSGALGRSGSVMSGPHGSDAQDEASDGERPSKRSRLAEYDIKGEDEFQAEQPARQACGLSPPSDDGDDIQDDMDIIDLEDAAEEKYWLEEFKQWLPKVEVEERLKERYAQVFKRQAGKAMPNTHNKQRMEEIVSCARDKDTTIRYILWRDKKIWCSKLKEAEKALRQEHDDFEKFRDLQKRAEYKNILDEHLITRMKARIQVVEKDLGIRKKVVKEMTKWVKD